MTGLGEGFFYYIVFSLTILIVYPFVITLLFRSSNLYASSQTKLKIFYLVLVYLINFLIILSIIRTFRMKGMLMLSILLIVYMIFNLINTKKNALK
jgi:prepilin signal peptidase PulO-like enzyme (type II secretory pathway)